MAIVDLVVIGFIIYISVIITIGQRKKAERIIPTPPKVEEKEQIAK